MMKYLLSFILPCTFILNLAAQQPEMDPLVKSGIQKYDAKNYAGASQDFSSFISKSKADIDKYLKQKADYDKLTDYEKALVESAQVFDGRNDLAVPYYYRGMCNLNTGSKDDAMSDFNMDISLDSKYADPLYERGKMKI